MDYLFIFTIFSFNIMKNGMISKRNIEGTPAEYVNQKNNVYTQTILQINKQQQQ